MPGTKITLAPPRTIHTQAMSTASHSIAHQNLIASEGITYERYVDLTFFVTDVSGASSSRRSSSGARCFIVIID